MAQGHRRVTKNTMAVSSARYSLGGINYYLLTFLLVRSGNKAKLGVKFRHLTHNASAMLSTYSAISEVH